MVRQKALAMLDNLECSSRIAASDENTRNQYWKPSHDYSSNPLSPTKKEVLRSQLMHQQNNATNNQSSVTLYTTRSTAFSAAHGPEALDITRFRVDTRVQDLLAQPNSRQRRPGNIPDHRPHNNVNSLRFQREQAFTNPLLKDGGTNYGPNACIGNWVEERVDPSFKSGFHARELGILTRYESESMERFKAHPGPYKVKFLDANRTAKLPEPGQGSKINANGADGTYVYYSRGFGDTPYLDHTAPGRRGCPWVGTAPFKQYESVARSTANRDGMEFQARVSLTDPKSKVLTGCYPKEVEEAQANMEKDKLSITQRHTSTWKTMYKSEILQRSATPSTYRPMSVSAEWSSAKKDVIVSIRPRTTLN